MRRRSTDILMHWASVQPQKADQNQGVEKRAEKGFI